MEVPEDWAEIEGALQREFHFKDFSAAINFVNPGSSGSRCRGGDSLSRRPRPAGSSCAGGTHAAQAVTDRDA